MLDFSTCCNPYKPPPAVYSAIGSADIRQYPDIESASFIKALSRHSGMPTDCLIAGSGSTEIIRLAAMAFLGKGDTVVIPSPTYSEYELASRITGANVVIYRLNELNGFRLDAKSLVSFSGKFRPSAIFICNPNNPTGQILHPKDIKDMAIAFPDSLIIVDEAYIAFSEGEKGFTLPPEIHNVLVIRSMTKDYSLAGLRLGYAISSSAIISALKKVRPPWNVSLAAQMAGIAALSCRYHLSRCMERIHSSRIYLEEELAKLGFKSIPTDVNFFIFKVRNAGHFTQMMRDKGILVRDCTSFGLPQYIRIAPRTRPECMKLIKAAGELQGEAQ